MRVAEGVWRVSHGVVIGRGQRLGAGSSSRRTTLSREPVGVGMLGRQLGLDLLVVDDPALRGVDQEHPARVQALLEQRCSPAGMSSTPTSEAMTTSPSLVT